MPDDLLEQARGAQVHEPLVDDRHRIARLLDEEDRALRVDLVVRADRLLHERQIAADEPSRRASRARRRATGRVRSASGGQGVVSAVISDAMVGSRMLGIRSSTVGP